MRAATVERKTRETEIFVSLDLDGDGEYDVDTGIGFLDHMLEQLSRHGLIDLKVRADGDLHIDMHHTVEDVGIVMGQALRKALADRRGITRYAHAYVPMDETLSRAAIDVSGRPWLVWKVTFPHGKVGDMDTELFREWFQAFAQHAGLTLHIENLYGDNCHHIIESVFKAVARALCQAIAVDPARSGAIPSTKGMLEG